MNYNIHVRDEFFGATIFNLQTGKREYVNNKELSEIIKFSKFPRDSITKPELNPCCIKHIRIDKKIENGFSFADIAFIELTRACNLRCIHCLNNSSVPQKNQMSPKEIEKLIKEMAAAGLQEIRFTGGEPLLHKDIYKFIQLTTQLGMYTSLGTNGTLVTKETAKKLSQAGLKKVVISIDGTQEKHDKIRGLGNYQKSFDAMHHLIDTNIDIRINSVIMKSNMQDIIKFAKYVNDEKIMLFIRRFIESGRGVQLKNNTLNRKDYDYVREKLQCELQKGGYVNGHYLRNDEGIKSRIPLPFEIKGCKAGQRAIAVMPNGDLHLCGFLAAQGFPSQHNVKDIKDWSLFWRELQNSDTLSLLHSNLNLYNSIPNVQTTYCLAYVQNYLNKKKDAQC